jgi:hypothetical protein
MCCVYFSLHFLGYPALWCGLTNIRTQKHRNVKQKSWQYYCLDNLKIRKKNCFSVCRDCDPIGIAAALLYKSVHYLFISCYFVL